MLLRIHQKDGELHDFGDGKLSIDVPSVAVYSSRPKYLFNTQIVFRNGIITLYQDGNQLYNGPGHFSIAN